MSDCPGCPLENTAYDKQLLIKQNRLARALQAYPRLGDIEVAPVVASPRLGGYRNRARMVLNPEAAQPQDLLGFYEEGSRTIVPVTECAAHHPQIETLLRSLRPRLFSSPALREFTRFVDVRCTAGHALAPEAEATLVTFAGGADAPVNLGRVEAEASQLFDALQIALGDLGVSVHLNISEDATQSVLSGEQRVIGGAPFLSFAVENAGDSTPKRALEVPPGAFFQVNLDQLAQVHQRIRPEMAKSGALLDFYCGVGTHAIALADAPGHAPILGFDVSEAAIAQARQNAEGAGLKAQFLAADELDAARWVEEQLTGADAAAHPVTILTNPARAGMSPGALRLIDKVGADAIFYLSCQPETLARDLDRLLDRGFEVIKLEAFDFMPQTDQVETLAVLRRKKDAPSARFSYERAYQPLENRRFSPGVSGPAGLSGDVSETVWIGLVAGEVPKQGFLPHDRSKKAAADQGRIKVERLRKHEGNSVIRIFAETLDDVQIRRRLRAWQHPVLGDPDFGDRNANHLLARHGHLDRLALHCVGAKTDTGWQRAPVPGQFLPILRLPRPILEEVGD